MRRGAVSPDELSLYAKQEQRLRDAVELLRTVAKIASKRNICHGHGDYADMIVLGKGYGEDGFELLARIKKFLGDTNA